MLFGLGWGRGNLGPAILLTGMGLTQGILFALAMIAGMAISSYFNVSFKVSSMHRKAIKMNESINDYSTKI